MQVRIVVGRLRRVDQASHVVFPRDRRVARVLHPALVRTAQVALEGHELARHVPPQLAVEGAVGAALVRDAVGAGRRASVFASRAVFGGVGSVVEGTLHSRHEGRARSADHSGANPIRVGATRVGPRAAVVRAVPTAAHASVRVGRVRRRRRRRRRRLRRRRSGRWRERLRRFGRRRRLGRSATVAGVGRVRRDFAVADFGGRPHRRARPQSASTLHVRVLVDLKCAATIDAEAFKNHEIVPGARGGDVAQALACVAPRRPRRRVRRVVALVLVRNQLHNVVGRGSAAAQRRKQLVAIRGRRVEAQVVQALLGVGRVQKGLQVDGPIHGNVPVEVGVQRVHAPVVLHAHETVPPESAVRDLLAVDGHQLRNPTCGLARAPTGVDGIVAIQKVDVVAVRNAHARNGAVVAKRLTHVERGVGFAHLKPTSVDAADHGLHAVVAHELHELDHTRGEGRHHRVHVGLVLRVSQALVAQRIAHQGKHGTRFGEGLRHRVGLDRVRTGFFVGGRHGRGVVALSAVEAAQIGVKACRRGAVSVAERGTRRGVVALARLRRQRAVLVVVRRVRIEPHGGVGAALAVLGGGDAVANLQQHL